MHKLVDVIESIWRRLEKLKRHSLKETPTRTIIIDPILEALGWDVRDPDEVQLEYPTVAGKSVDYALKLNVKPVLLIEAKSMDDPLNNVKSTAQVVAYAANDGIAWCVLTNGIKWKVYRSIEECPAPEKLMFEVALDPQESEGLTPKQIAQQLWRLSREEMARGTLDELGEQTFTDAKVRKALETLCVNPPRAFLNLLRRIVGNESLSPRQVTDSLARISSDATSAGLLAPTGVTVSPPPSQTSESAIAARAAGDSVARERRGPKKYYEEDLHTNGKPQEVLELYRAIERFCGTLAGAALQKRYLKKHVAFERGRKVFCSVHLRQGGLRVWLRLKFSRLENPPSFVRDVSSVGHWGVGDVELAITAKSQLQDAYVLIRQSFESQG